jgi:hypothetical protein
VRAAVADDDGAAAERARAGERLLPEAVALRQPARGAVGGVRHATAVAGVARRGGGERGRAVARRAARARARQAAQQLPLLALLRLAPRGRGRRRRPAPAAAAAAAAAARLARGRAAVARQHHVQGVRGRALAEHGRALGHPAVRERRRERGARRARRAAARRCGEEAGARASQAGRNAAGRVGAARQRPAGRSAAVVVSCGRRPAKVKHGQTRAAPRRPRRTCRPDPPPVPPRPWLRPLGRSRALPAPWRGAARAGPVRRGLLPCRAGLKRG